METQEFILKYNDDQAAEQQVNKDKSKPRLLKRKKGTSLGFSCSFRCVWNGCASRGETLAGEASGFIVPGSASSLCGYLFLQEQTAGPARAKLPGMTMCKSKLGSCY